MWLIKIIKKLFKRRKIICPKCHGADVSKDSANYTSNEAFYSYRCNKCHLHFVPYIGYTSNDSGYSGYRKDYLKRTKRHR